MDNLLEPFLVMTVAFRVHKDNVNRGDGLIEFTGQQHRTVWDRVIIHKHQEYNLRVLCTLTGVMYDVEFVSHTKREENKAPVFIFRIIRKCSIDYTLSPEQNLRLEPKWMTFYQYGMIPVNKQGQPLTQKRANKSGFVICKHMQSFREKELNAYFNYTQYAFEKQSYIDGLKIYINDVCHQAFQKLDDEYVAYMLNGTKA